MNDRKEAKLLAGYIGAKPKTSKEIERLYRRLILAGQMQEDIRVENVVYSDNVLKKLSEENEDFAYVILEKENAKSNSRERFQVFSVQRCREPGHNSNFLPISQKGKMLFLVQREIAYMERSKRTTYIHTAGGIVTCSEKLDELLARLPENNFCRCHVSFVINMHHVKYLSRTMAELDSGESIPISRKYTKIIRNFGRHE